MCDVWRNYEPILDRGEPAAIRFRAKPAKLHLILRYIQKQGLQSYFITLSWKN